LAAINPLDAASGLAGGVLLPSDVKARSEQKQTAQLETLPHTMQTAKTEIRRHISDIAA